MSRSDIRINDCDLIALVATPVDDGYFVRDQDCQWLEKELKRVLDRLKRIRGKRLVVTNGRIVTAYHASRRQGRLLLRNAHECELSDCQ